ncbi:DUF3151 family protein [Agromyces sp. SYSU T00194]|uniref:DUF3151 family protein n=1 Tax=Agromyces chitinivorans TaxID=3158560 RepID=UPI003398BB55
MSADETNGRTERYLPDETAVREALQGGGRSEVAGIVGAHPQSPLAWAELADIADSEGRVTDSYASATVAVDRAREALREVGWQPGDAVPWAHEPNRAYLRALDAKRRAANVLGIAAEAVAAAEELAAADADAQMRIASEFTPTQVISLDEVQAMLAERAAAQVAEAEAAIAAEDAALAAAAAQGDQPVPAAEAGYGAPVSAADAASPATPALPMPAVPTTTPVAGVPVAEVAAAPETGEPGESEPAVPAPVPASWALDGAPAPTFTADATGAVTEGESSGEPAPSAEDAPEDVDAEQADAADEGDTASEPSDDEPSDSEASAAAPDEADTVSVDDRDGGR